MFTYTFTKTALSAFAATVLSISIAPLAYADISKCKDIDGRIVYSDVSCGDAVLIEHIADVPTESDAAGVGRMSSTRVRSIDIASSDRGQIRESGWAHHDVTPAKKSLDKLTIHDARQALVASDSAMAFLRKQAIASNR